MTQYSHILRDAWEKLIADFRRGRFTPEEEGDIQCYLYALCLRRLRDPSKIHAEVPRGDGRFIDLVLGSNRLPVEIKWSYIRERRRVSKGWSGDVRKLSEQFSNRKPAFVLFLSTAEGTYFPEQRLTIGQKKALLKLTNLARKKGVNLLLPYRL